MGNNISKMQRIQNEGGDTFSYIKNQNRQKPPLKKITGWKDLKKLVFERR